MLWLISQLSEDASRRKIFVNSAVEMLKNYSFDGLDINWMHPTGEGGQPEDKVGCDLGTPRTTAAPWTVLGVLLVIAVWMIRFIFLILAGYFILLVLFVNASCLSYRFQYVYKLWILKSLKHCMILNPVSNVKTKWMTDILRNLSLRKGIQGKNFTLNRFGTGTINPQRIRPQR